MLWLALSKYDYSFSRKFYVFIQVLLDVIPGYAIREQTAEEKAQKQKKETRNLVNFEESLLRYHLKYLQLCEKLSNSEIFVFCI